jgi:S1-C subfamily serine protease
MAKIGAHQGKAFVRHVANGSFLRIVRRRRLDRRVDRSVGTRSLSRRGPDGHSTERQSKSQRSHRLNNGYEVTVLAGTSDRKGKAWVYVGNYENNNPIGWVFRDFIACTGVQARGQNNCRVMDPTGTPLNVRTTPNGHIVGTLSNGTSVRILDLPSIIRGKTWVYVGRSDNGTPIGWVYRDYLDCVPTQEAKRPVESATPKTIPPDEAPRQQQQTAVPTVVSSGSGFFVSTEGHIVTNAHVVVGCNYVRSSRGGQISRVAIDEQSDLALYVASEKPASAARLRSGKGPRVGEPVVAVGFPLKGLLSSDPIITSGVISALAGLNNDRRAIQITAPVQPGNSGGPLFGANGSVLGVVLGKLDALKMAEIIGDIPQNVNFAVSLGTLQSFLDANGVPYVLDDSPTTRSSADIAGDASRYTVFLECLR